MVNLRMMSTPIGLGTVSNYPSRYKRGNQRSTGITKLANILFMNELQKRLNSEKTAITCISVHPGEVNTFASRTPYPFIASIIMGLFFMLPEAGAHNSCFAAASPLIRQHPEQFKGAYLVPCGVIEEPGKNAKRNDLALELWKTSERLLKDIGIRFS